MPRRSPSVKEMKVIDSSLQSRLERLDKAMQEMESKMAVFDRKKRLRTAALH